jgi:hypothetical protein
MRGLVVFILIATALAGCADASAPEALDEADTSVEVTETTGGIRGLVVDAAVTPIEGANVEAISGGNAKKTTTDEDGLFTFGNLEPGVYVLKVSHPRYTEAQSSVEVVAGVEKPPLARIQIEQLFDADPFMDTQKYTGFVGCAFRLPLISSTCVNDYTRVDPTGTCPGGCAPQVTGVVDQREFQSYVDASWQSIIWEMAWESSVSGTADSLGLTVSFATRTGASHWYTSDQQGEGFRLQCDLGVVCEGQQNGADGEPMIAAEGQDDLWNMISAGDGVVVQQTIETFQSNFYHGVPPEGWSLIAGDESPF